MKSGVMRTCHLRNSIELHDSTVSSIAIEDRSVRIKLDAYVHRWNKVDAAWKGTGWIQPAEVVIVGAVITQQTEFPVELGGGKIIVEDVVYNNLVPLPLSSSGPTMLQLHLVAGGVLEFCGDDLAMEAMGEGRYIEELPDEFKPSDAV